MTEPNSIIAGRYRVLREIGRGGMGVVYAVQHLNTGETLALKLLLAHTGGQAEILERFKREMRAPALIKSDHVVRITDADVAPEIDGALFLVMELLDGCDLEQLLQKRGPFSPEETVWLLSQAARALDKAHAAGVVHRDLKPENLFIHRREDLGCIVKLLDFGVAHLKHRDASTSEMKVTKSGDILGTPMYLSPEQAMGDSDELGPHSDIWSIGLIVFELLVGKTYFQADSVTKLIGQICFQPLPPASARGSTLGPAFDRWFERSVTRDIKGRWPSVGAQIAALAEAIGVSSQVAQSDAPASLVTAVNGIKEPTAGLGSARSREARTTTSEGRGQSAARHASRRWLMAAGLLLMAGGVVGLGALVGRLRSPQSAGGKDLRSTSARPDPTLVAVDGGTTPATVSAPPVAPRPPVPTPPGPPTKKAAEAGSAPRRKLHPTGSASKSPGKRPPTSNYDPVAP